MAGCRRRRHLQAKKSPADASRRPGRYRPKHQGRAEAVLEGGRHRRYNRRRLHEDTVSGTLNADLDLGAPGAHGHDCFVKKGAGRWRFGRETAWYVDGRAPAVLLCSLPGGHPLVL